MMYLIVFPEVSSFCYQDKYQCKCAAEPCVAGFCGASNFQTWRKLHSYALFVSIVREYVSVSNLSGVVVWVCLLEPYSLLLDLFFDSGNI